MSAQPNEPVLADQPGEPSVGSSSVPVGLFVLSFVLLYWAMYSFDLHSGWFSPHVYTPYRSEAELALYQPPSGGADLALGKSKFEQVCALCHNTDGSGKPNQAPPLAGSEWVLGPPSHFIRIPLSGLTGPVQVKGTTWNLAMPAMGATMTDEELAAVLTYISQSWGNKSAGITPDQIKAVRAQVGNRQAWTADELKTVQ